MRSREDIPQSFRCLQDAKEGRTQAFMTSGKSSHGGLSTSCSGSFSVGFETPGEKKFPCQGKSKDYGRDSHRRLACVSGGTAIGSWLVCRGKGECEDKAMWRSAEVSWRGAVAWDFVFSHR